MVCLPIEMDEDVEEILDNNDYVVKRKGGRSLIDKPPKFSPDETCLFLISGRGIQIYDVVTTEFVRSLKDKTNSFPIVGMCFPPNDDRSLVTCTEDGSVVNWKWHAAVQSSKLALKLPANSRIISFDLVSADAAVIGLWNDVKTAVAVVSLTGDGVMKMANTLRNKTSLSRFWSVAIGSCGDKSVVAVSNGSPFVNVFAVDDPDTCLCHAVSKNVSATSVAWHPTLDVLAVGDTLGRVMLWSSPSTLRQPPREVKHWHHLPLAAVTYSIMGGVLLTGGAERVMVAWGSGNSRRFVPRMPAEILHMASSRSHFVVSTADNGIQIIDSSSLYIVGCIREAGGLGGLRRQTAKGNSRGPCLQYAHPASSLLLPAGPGHLHMYSTATDSLVYTLDVTNTNIVPPERDNLQPEQIEVLEMSVGCRGQWLCTWEGRSEQERLRWFGQGARGGASGGGWALHTVVARPHRPAAPSALHMATDVPMTVTYDDDNQLKFWTLIDSVPGYEGKAAWSTVAQGRPSGGPAGGAAVSGDGSLCAAWAGACLTLWDPRLGRQRACLAHPALRPQGRAVQFGRDHHMHLVACTTDTTLAVWNTLSLRLTWLVRLDTSYLIADPFSDRVAAVTKDNDVFVFRMSSSRPLVTLLGALPAHRGAITSAAFAPSQRGPTDFRLYLLREQQEIFILERSELDGESSQTLERIPTGLRPAPSAYSALVAEKKTSMVKTKSASGNSFISTRAAITELLLATPAHAQPSLKSICSPFLRTIARSQITPTGDELVCEDVKTEIKSEPDEKDTDHKVTKNERKILKKLEEDSLEWVNSLLDTTEMET